MNLTRADIFSASTHIELLRHLKTMNAANAVGDEWQTIESQPSHAAFRRSSFIVF
jgi:hypothetical protein